MFQFLNPIWLLGISALLVPVLIHLWNIRPGKVLKIGSVSLMDAASRKSSRSFKLLDVPLFILRCLLLLLLALLLAVPAWQKKAQTAKVKGWILLPKETLKPTYTKFKAAIDSLTRAGFEFHYFNTGFTKSSLQQIFLHPQDSIPAALPSSKMSEYANYWDLVKELDANTSSTLPVYIFTPNQARHFTGSKPLVSLNLHWQTYTPADSVSTWIQDAWFTPNGSIKVVKGESTPMATTYSYATVEANDRPDASFSINTTGGQPTIALTGSGQAVTIDTATARIIIYTDNYATDAGYLKAALQAIAQFSERRYNIKTVSNAAAIPAGTSWLFWLSEKRLSNQVLSNCRQVLSYQSGKPYAVNTFIKNSGLFTTAVTEAQRVNLYKLTTSASASEPVWTDGYGHTVLNRAQAGKTQVYYFYSHFNPAWNDLVWSNNFPGWMLQLMVPANNNPALVYDRRTLSHQQYQPQIISAEHNAVTVKTAESKSLVRYFWLALMLAFAAERWLAHRTLKTNNN